jgi:prepilin-type N-terminal cleavage/methylation domain
MKFRKGFTLIELVIVIVILAILAVVAAPKFISLRKESLTNTLLGMRSAIEGAGQQTFSMAAVRGLETSAATSITTQGLTIPLVYGYPAGGVSSGLPALIEFPDGDWNQRASVYAGAWVYWHGTLEEDAGVGQCYLRYRQPTAAGLKPVIDIQTTGCE